MTQKQALGIDISNWARAGGVNFDKVQQHIMKGTYDFLIIKAGLGLGKSATFEEQRKGAEAKNIAYSTYYFPDANRNIKKQAKHYVDLVGTDQPSYIVDVELPYPKKDGGRLPTRKELSEFLDELEKLVKKRPVIYSRIDVLSQVRFLTAAKNYKLWIAWYPWDVSLLPHKQVQYNSFTDFLDDYANTRPSTIRGTNLAKNVILWQFSSKGKGRHYIFNKRTADPRHPDGKEFADLNVSVQERDVFMKAMFGDTSQIDTSSEIDDTEPEEAIEATYPGMTNQDMINLFLEASSIHEYWEWILDAQLEYLAVPRENRDKIYTGPKIEDLPNLEKFEKDALLDVMNVN
jgi:GH25 family lysozyme M1 (1,4-beta-N-acetylmuramidase)